jgi:YVTN family beta-propeller protein
MNDKINSLSVIDVKKRNVIGTVDVGIHPDGTAVGPGGRED